MDGGCGGDDFFFAKLTPSHGHFHDLTLEPLAIPRHPLETSQIHQ